MSGLKLPACGKINLSLDVLARRADGYHELSSVMQSIGLADELCFQLNLAGDVNFECTDPGLAHGENLVVKAARLLKERFGVDRGVDIHLRKKLPVAAGLGGGSSDAAVTLKALNHLWGLGLSISHLVSLGRELGADVPFCLLGGTALAQGIGETITILPPVPRLWLVLVKPAVGLRAGQVYRRWDELQYRTNRYTPGVLKAIDQGDREQVLQAVGNDLERVVRSLVPEVEEILRKLVEAGAAKAMVSGSGPTVLGFVETREQAAALCRKLSNAYPEVYFTHTI
ncbi:MAG TPA: 4-(cytidine 5'-diphospho)-2-C-methyl-D-erythritol kinase [Clostridia bacterium]|nr:4-(cytidine 5'-diphospho)-2-C-methyl-D-erythritol kinase [Clostridia bacterium]